MSHSVDRWLAKMAALGLLVSLVALSGSNCMNELLPGVGLATNNSGSGTGTTPSSGGTSTGQQNTVPTITVVSPTVDQTINPGQIVQISWTLFDPSHDAQVKVFYDTDNNASNGFTTLTIINDSAAGPDLL